MSTRDDILTTQDGLANVINMSLKQLEADTGLRVLSIWVDRDSNDDFTVAISMKVGEHTIEVSE